MAYKLIVENFGKINKAEIEICPLTLFVGDNNSGKSYLLSLIWALFEEMWILHIMEFKKSITTSSIKKSKIQLIMGIYNARAIAGFFQHAN